MPGFDGSVSDPDPHWFWSTGSGSAWSMRIQEGTNLKEKVKKFKLLKCRMVSF